MALAAGVLTLALMAWPAHLYSTWSWDLSYALPAAVLIFGLAVAPAALPSRAMALPVMVLLSEASYAFYLVHQPMLAFLGSGRWAFEVSLTNIAFEAFTLGAILALAVGLHVLWNAPRERTCAASSPTADPPPRRRLRRSHR